MSHLTDNNTTYFKHMRRAISLCGQSLKASACFLIHAFIPDVFEYTGSDIIKKMSDELNLKT
jgi:hypothetical protein